jgi:Zn-dependent M28 family amino/carboxypeptidase
VERLAGQIGPRSVFQPAALDAAAAYITGVWTAQGYAVTRQTYEVNKVACANLSVEIPGPRHPAEIVVIGAHYDTVDETPGANDNASGVAALLELSRRFKSGSRGPSPSRTIRLVAFVNEEPPWFETPLMGSRVYARACRERGDRIVAMLSLETIGYYSSAAGSQHYPPFFRWFYPDTGNFLAFVADRRSRPLLQQTVGAFRAATDFPAECCSTWAAVPGVGWSDHASFWHEGFPAVMVTDTAPFRYPHYHQPADTPEKLDYESLAKVTAGLAGAVRVLAAK